MKKSVEVSIVKCKSYKQSEVDSSISKALKLSGVEIFKNKKVLIKPNIVSADVKNIKATITQLPIIESVCKILKKNNCQIFIGESSFMNTHIFFKKIGLDKLAKKYGAKLVIFEQDKLINIKDEEAKILKVFPVAKIVKDVDVIVNLPKLKTHQLMRFTGAVKNLFGLIPGGLKQKFHAKAPSEKKFAKLMIDIYQNFNDKVCINIMDGVIGMEGKGPTSGEPVNSGFILVSKDAVSLDVVSSQLIGFNSKKILTNKEAVKRELGSYDFELKGLKKLPNLNFKKPYVALKTIRSVLFALRQKPIVVDEKKCVKCGICAKHCPVKAITLSPYLVIDKKKCIRCFCCIEICPENALSLKGG